MLNEQQVGFGIDSISLVRGLYEAHQDRDWSRAATFLHPGAAVDMPSTGERLVGREKIISFQRAYPEPWGIMSVGRVLSDTEGAAAEVTIVDPSGQRFALAAFWRSQEGLLHRGVEYWVTVGAELPPSSRISSEDTRAARQAWVTDQSDP
jgi:SnoaL-like protein